ncbi:MAG: ASCH domain-containing protein [Bacilli bacterium]|nr:ASCH domain-containing protein [Bacilli bacterium]
MKIITLKQPWATLIAEGLKEYEFRSWKLNYRGELLIHAGAGEDKEAMEKYKYLGLEFPHKRIIAKVVVEDCIKLTPEINKEINKSNPLVYGNYNRDSYAWKLTNITKIKNDKEVSGQQGLWNYNEE